MATIIDLDEARRRKALGARPVEHHVFVFDLSAPGTYEAARHVDLRAEFVPTIAPGATEGRIAARVALRACERGVGRPFALALMRLVHRWGEPVDALETLAQAAGVAKLKLEDVLDAAYDPRRDGELERAEGRLRRAR